MPKSILNIREHILGVTRSMISESGQQELSIRNIAAKCGIGTGTLYNYFSSKQDVIAAIIMQEWELALGKMDTKIKSQADCPEKLREIFAELSGFVQSIHSIWREDGSYEMANCDMSHIHEKKKDTRAQLRLRITEVIHGNIPFEDEAGFADILSRLFFSYSAEDGYDYGMLDCFIRKLLA